MEVETHEFNKNGLSSNSISRVFQMKVDIFLWITSIEIFDEGFLTNS